MATTSNPFEGMTFSQAAQMAEEQPNIPQVQTQQAASDDPFAGLRFSDVVEQQKFEEEKTMSRGMKILLGRRTDDTQQDAAVDNLMEGMSEDTTQMGVTEQADKRAADEAAAQREQRNVARQELAGEPSGFVSGREQIPFNFEGSPTKEHLRTQVEAGNEEFMHRVKYLGQSILMDTAGLIDFVREAPSILNPFNYMGDLSEPAPTTIEVDGQQLKLDQSWSENTEQIIKDTYELMGQSPELEKARDAGDIFLRLLGGNVSGSSLITGGRMAVSKASGVVDDTLGKFLRNEMAVNIAGATVGTGAAELAGKTIEDKENIAMVGNIGGILGWEVLKNIPSVQAGRAIFRKAAKAKELFDSDDVYGMAKDRVLKYLGGFVPQQEIPKIEQRMELVRRIQKLEPDFKPTVGNIIGTEESRLIQRITDTNNYTKADEQYKATKAAVERLTARLSKDTEPAQKAMILEALRMLSDDTLAHAQRITDQMSTLETKARRIKKGDTAGSQAGEDIREQLKNLQKSYEEVMDTVYKGVDPDGTAQFDARGLISKVKSIADDTSDLDRILDTEDTGYRFVTQILPKYITKLSKRSGEGVPDTLEQMGFVIPGQKALKESQKEIPYLTFEEMKKLNTNIRKRAVKIKRQDPSSNAPRVLNDIAEQLDDMIATKMIKGDEGVRTRYERATRFAGENFYPRFTQGVGGKLLREDPATGDFFVRGDEVGPMFWKAGPKESNLEDFQKLFSREHAIEKGMLSTKDEEAFKASSEAASEVAREHLKSYAMRTLQDDLDRAPGASSLNVLEAWKVKYKGALDTFKDIADEVDALEVEFRGLESSRRANTTAINKMNKEVIERYSGMQQSTILDSIFKRDVSVEDVEKLVDDIYRGTARKVAMDETDALREGRIVERTQPNVGPSGFESLFPPIERINMKTPEMVRIQNALRDSLTSELIARAYDPKLEGPSWTTFNKLIKNKRMRAKLEKVYDEETLKGIDDFGQSLRLMGEENKPVTLKELNAVKDFMNKLGFSPASVLSRYYSHALGKVGPLYLAADAFTRLFTGVSQKHFDQVYREIMYDLDGLEQVLKHTGAEDSAELINKTKEMLKKQGAAALQAMTKGTMAKLFSDHAFANYGKTLNFLDQYEEAQEGHSSDKSFRSLVDYYLEMNDDKTGQASRIQATPYDRDGIETEDDIFTEFESEDNPEQNPYEYWNETHRPAPTEPEVPMTDATVTEDLPDFVGKAKTTEEVETVAKIVADSFDEAGLDPEVGLIFGQIESSMGRFVEAETSSAKGVFQFIDGTWKEQIGKHADKYGFDPEEADVFNVRQNALMGAEFMKGNARVLKNAGFDASPENLYAAHFLGAGGASKFLKSYDASPKAVVDSKKYAKEIRANPSIFRDSKGRLRTYEGVYNIFEQKIDKARSQVQSYLETTSDTAEA